MQRYYEFHAWGAWSGWIQRAMDASSNAAFLATVRASDRCLRRLIAGL